MKFTVLALPALLASAAMADVGVVEATAAFKLPGSATTSYATAIGTTGNPSLSGYNFGSVNVLTGQTLTLQNWYFENYAYNGGNTPVGAATNNNWLDNASTASLTVIVQNSAAMVVTGFTLAQTSTIGNNRFWQLAPGQQSYANLAAGLSNGTYSVQFSTTYNFNQWTGSTSQVITTTATSTASFTVIPAPGAAALVGLAGLIASRRRAV